MPIRLFFGPVVAGVLIIGLPLLIWYPITRQSHARLREEIARKQEAARPAP
jgi:Na+/melibiose symporter-like transporter